MDTTNWKNFCFGDYCEQIYKAKAYTRENLTECNWKYKLAVPFVTRTENNNCVECYVINDEELNIEDGNALVIGDTTATVSWQPAPFVTGDHIVVIRASWLNGQTGLFIATILNKERYRYSYGRAFKTEFIKNTILRLPATPDGDVDWQWIENYMKSIQKKIQIPTTSHKNSKPLPLNVDNWKKFRVGDLFRLETGKVNSTELLEEGNDCYYLGAKKEDNGIMSKCKYNQDFITKGNCIVFICDGQGSIGLNNYMDRDFIATVNLIMGYNKHLNPLIGCFLVTILDLERPKFSFGRKRKTHLADTEIALPATADGTPDWLFMENYVKSLPYGDCL